MASSGLFVSQKGGLSHVLSIVYIWGDEKSPAFQFSRERFLPRIVTFASESDLTFTCLLLLVKC